VSAREDELETRELKLRRVTERQKDAADRLERQAADLAERERALARLGQTLLARRDGDAPPEARTETEIPFSQGLEALSDAARSIRPRR